MRFDDPKDQYHEGGRGSAVVQCRGCMITSPKGDDEVDQASDAGGNRKMVKKIHATRTRTCIK